jgi:hypothetical protein
MGAPASTDARLDFNNHTHRLKAGREIDRLKRRALEAALLCKSWQCEGRRGKAMVRTVKPNAKLTPRNPMPSVGNPAASTALPQPAKVSQNVPKNSAPRRFDMSIEVLPNNPLLISTPEAS